MSVKLHRYFIFLIIYMVTYSYITEALKETCLVGFENTNTRYLLFNVNYGEGFNLRRDVYMRIANLVRKLNEIEPWTLVLPLWGDLYHWRNTPRNTFYHWKNFFDVDSLKKWIPVIELEDFLNDEWHLDSAFILQYFEDMWEKGWIERYNISNCKEKNNFWKNSNDVWQTKLWNKNITFSNFSCLSYQGMASTIIPFLTKDQPYLRSVFLDHAEILLHDDFGTNTYWSVRRSMRFASHLVAAADKFRKNHLNSDDETDKTKVAKDWKEFRPKNGDALGGPYLAAHLRRRDFIYARKDEIPSIEETANQLRNILNQLKLKKLYVASDAPVNEMRELRSFLKDFEVFQFSPSEEFQEKFGDGGAAIIDQIICSHARYFIGTYESTFSFRIQEEREILGFSSDTTYNRLCGSNPTCDPPSKWKIVYD